MANNKKQKMNQLWMQEEQQYNWKNIILLRFDFEEGSQCCYKGDSTWRKFTLPSGKYQNKKNKEYEYLELHSLNHGDKKRDVLCVKQKLYLKPSNNK